MRGCRRPLASPTAKDKVVSPRSVDGEACQAHSRRYPLAPRGEGVPLNVGDIPSAGMGEEARGVVGVLQVDDEQSLARAAAA